MKGWNYRVIIEDVPDGVAYRLIEAYYDDDGEIRHWTAADRPYGDTLDELRGDLTHMLEALGRKPLTPTDLPS
jgi:hypothetical protein